MTKSSTGFIGVLIAAALVAGALAWFVFGRERPMADARRDTVKPIASERFSGGGGARNTTQGFTTLQADVEAQARGAGEGAGLRGQDEPPAQYEFEAQEPPPLNWRYRLSALVRSGSEVKAGIIDRASNESFLLGVGEAAGEVLVRAIDYDQESVVVSAGSEDATLVLEYGPGLDDWHADAEEEPPLYRGAGIEAFLKEHPEAEYKAAYRAPGEYPDADDNAEEDDGLPEPEQGFEEPYDPAMNLGEGIEGFLQRNPHLEKQAREPAEGQGPEIEKFLQEKANQGERPGR